MKNHCFHRSVRSLLAAMLSVGYLLGGEAIAQVSSKPEKSQLEVSIAAWGATSIPTAVALDGGYFAKHGLAVNISVVAASTSVQALISGRVDIYQGGPPRRSAKISIGDSYGQDRSTANP